MIKVKLAEINSLTGGLDRKFVLVDVVDMQKAIDIIKNYYYDKDLEFVLEEIQTVKIDLLLGNTL